MDTYKRIFKIDHKVSLGVAEKIKNRKKKSPFCLDYLTILS